MDDKTRRPGTEVPPSDADIDRTDNVRRSRYGGPGGGGGNSALALIVGALAVAIIIGAFFWFSRDTGDTVAIDQPGVTTEERALESPQSPPADTGEEPAATPPGQTGTND
jgi:hypothetical protein